MKQLPIAIVGGNGFGRYPIISREETFNMIVSDDFLVPFAGYKKVLAIAEKGSGRGLFNSVRFGNLIAVIDNGVYIIGATLHAQRVGSCETFEGDVLIAYTGDGTIEVWNWRQNAKWRVQRPHGLVQSRRAWWMEKQKAIVSVDGEGIMRFYRL